MGQHVEAASWHKNEPLECDWKKLETPSFCNMLFWSFLSWRLIGAIMWWQLQALFQLCLLGDIRILQVGITARENQNTLCQQKNWNVREVLYISNFWKKHVGLRGKHALKKVSRNLWCSLSAWVKLPHVLEIRELKTYMKHVWKCLKVIPQEFSRWMSTDSTEALSPIYLVACNPLDTLALTH